MSETFIKEAFGNKEDWLPVRYIHSVEMGEIKPPITNRAVDLHLHDCTKITIISELTQGAFPLPVFSVRMGEVDLPGVYHLSQVKRDGDDVFVEVVPANEETERLLREMTEREGSDDVQTAYICGQL